MSLLNILWTTLTSELPLPKMKDNILLTKDDLKEMVSNVIESLSACTDLLTEDYIGEDEMMFNSPCVVLNEGLIMSYPIEDVINTLARCNSLLIGNKMLSILRGENTEAKGCIYIAKSPNENTEDIFVIIPKGKANKEIIDSKMKKYGWVCVKEMDYVYSDKYQKLAYERKFDIDATDLVCRENYLYHICPNIKVEKILKQGLLPKENSWPSWDLSDNTMGDDYRVYLFVNVPNDMFLAKWKSEFKCGKIVSDKNEGYSLLKIDVSKIGNDKKFYFDPRAKYSVYTREVIPPQAIKKIKEI